MHEDARKLANNPATRKHWYSFTFVEGTKMSTTFLGFLERNRVSVARIIAAREQVKMSPQSILMNVSYLGHMTQKTFMEGVEVVDTPPQAEQITGEPDADL